MNEKPVDIFIYDSITGAYFRLPQIPEEFEWTDGERQVDTAQIVGLGSVDFLNGVDLDNVTWSCTFPAHYDPSYCTFPGIHEPVVYRNQFSTWKDAGTTLQLICPAYGINHPMYIKTFTWKATGPEGDIDYTVVLRQVRVVAARKVTAGGEVLVSSAKTPDKRPAVPAKTTPKQYTVQAGDNLVYIAKKLGIADWHTLYDKNKTIIGNNPNTIKPGQVFTV